MRKASAGPVIYFSLSLSSREKAKGDMEQTRAESRILFLKPEFYFLR
jgi:hypothetical protein